MTELGYEYEAEDTLKDKYLTFVLDKAVYAVALCYVTEILHMTELIPLPDTPDYVKGLLSLRGEVIPVIDLRMKLGLATTEYGDRTCIVLLSADGFKLGLIVDMASEVVKLAQGTIEPDQSEGSAYLAGKAQSGENIVDILAILREDEAGETAQAN